MRTIVFSVLLVITSTLLFSQNRSAKFIHLSMKDGLSNNEVTAIFKDSKGFLWFGTSDGLNKYDGYTFTVYKNDVNNPKSISGNLIVSIVEDHNGQLWIGSSAGLDKLERETETFVHISTKTPNSKNSRINTISSLLVDYQGYLWIGINTGLLKLNTKTGELIDIFENSSLKKQLQGISVRCIYEDKSKNLWFGTWFGGLVKLDPSRKHFSIFKNNPADPLSLPENTVSAFYEDKFNRLWVGTQSSGLSIYAPANQKFYKLKNPLINGKIQGIVAVENHQIWVCQDRTIAEINETNLNQVYQYKNDIKDIQSFTPSNANTMYKDNTGIVWIGTGAGILFWDEARDKFSAYYFNIVNDAEKYYSKTFYFDPENNTWIGTFGKGLFIYNPAKKVFSRYTASKNGLASDFIFNICEIKSGLYWIGTMGGISIFDAKSRKVVGKITHDASNANSIYNNVVQQIFKDSRNNIWVVTQESLDLIRGNKFIHFTKNKLNGLSHYKIMDLIEDRSGNIWIATKNGLNKYDWKSGKITQYFNNPNNKNSLSSSELLSLYEDSNGTIWVGTRKGLDFYVKKSNSFKPYLFNDKINNTLVFKITEDNKKNLWIVTPTGLSKLNTKTAEIKNYNETDGLNNNVEALTKDKNGNIYLGGTHTGFYKFNPASIIVNSLVPPIYITNFTIFNKTVPVEPDNNNAILQNNISATKAITLQYNQSVLEFEIAALNYTLSEKNQYKYKLEGSDKDWMKLKPGSRFIPYTNLNPGSYTLLVKGSNNDGVWNEKGVRLEITVLPPFWRTNIAFFIYFIFLTVSLIVFRSIGLKRYRQKTQVELEKLNATKIHEIDQMKLQFFANISHEFRTPLTLITGPLNKLMTEARNEGKDFLVEQYAMIQRNTLRLMLMINQLIDLQKSETGSLKLEMVYGELIPYFHTIYEKFLSLADEQGVDYQLITLIEKLDTSFDSDKLEKIVTNLLSNAFKFTKDKVILSIKFLENNLILEVEDNGIGIAEEHLTKIFENFYQVDNSSTRKNEGSGIGLALTRELVLLYKGNISAESEVGVGTTVKVVIPISAITLKISATEVRVVKNEMNTPAEKIESLVVVDEFDSENDDENPLVLIVEDNADLRLYIRSILGVNYRVAEAENGKIGVELAYQLLPEMIITDVMMPEMDGMELCQMLKNDERSSHIPIIMLTALNSTENELKGLETGADEYVTKPFHAELLLARIKNIIDFRRRLHSKFQQSIEIRPDEIVTNAADEKFLRKALELVEQNLNNLDFEIQQFIDGMNMSRAGLYVKIKALTGQSVSEFIKSIRLRHAAQMLLTREFTISEITYKVGFQNRTQFNRSFKEQYSLTPTEFIQAHTNN
ncbi:MAG: hybrid sensor histidine kinase/response regulator transcription factor [Bacteroidales bacterium]